MNFKINDAVFNKFPSIETKNLTLESFALQDAEELFRIRSDDRVTKYLDRDNHKTVEESEIMINGILKSYKDKAGISWIIREKASSAVVGYVGYWNLIRENVRAEIGYALKFEYWGKGYMSETLLKLLEFGFSEFKLHSIMGNVNPQNQRSIKILEKFGFKKEAHFREDYLYNGKYLDSEIYCLLETDFFQNTRT
ncbi:MAG: GNAT family N-acetyltransferase [Ignavibacteria bacterium]|jgi:ribosomal-protein-alanine N-acetyltransferase|nr:GNAT family N-acetyltransferase [Ignavibacteria bacterium]MCU7517015.1 GNAT family N-acetyltransferase [Ignavibacteria bacterium]